ncbi:acyltransferase [Butyrivibrio sp. XPD2006]|uniref:acyltransferase n=1 Tax=Butyrivibrio sp. XPD2006 TaxID=1280668 RepID=UPI0003B413D8|nr:acyltransferase [Butyrivibrio sp. XPD2006]
MTSQKEFKYENLISALISFMIILALISAAALPVITDFIYVGVETVNIHDDALTEGLLIMDNGSYTQPLTVEYDNLNRICLELTSAADTIANFSISLYGEDSEAVCITEFNDLEANEQSRYYWNLSDTGLIVGEPATFSIFMGGSENGNNPIIHSIEYIYGEDTLSASRIVMLIFIAALLLLLFSLVYLRITKSKTSQCSPSITASPKKSATRKVYFEIMRVLACSLVIYNHLLVYNQFMAAETVSRPLYMTLAMITRCNVPIFFMVSGALLLKKNEEFTTVFRKRFLRIIGLLIVFYLINIAALQYNCVMEGTHYNISIKEFVLGFLSRELPGSVVYWYLYAYLAYIFMLPFLQRLAKGITRAEFSALIALHFITATLIPMINLYLMKNGIAENILIDGNFYVPFAVFSAIFYPLIGYYLEYNVDIANVRLWQLCLLILGAAAGITLSNICTYIDAELNGTFSQNYVMLFDYLTAITVFMLIKYLYAVVMAYKETGILVKAICFTGSMTLGIYMFDPVFKELFYSKFIIKTQSMSVMWQGLLWILISMTLGTICTFILKKTSLFKNLL